jgi:rSAM-associated Gly-rich repeat protein
MAIPNRSYLFCLLLLASLPVDGAAALAVANAQGSAALPGPSLSIEERLSRIAAAVQQQGGVEEAPGGELSYVFVNGNGLGWGNGGFRNGGFHNGGFHNGGFRNAGFGNGGFRNGGFGNGGFRNGGFRNGGFLNGGGRYWR